MSLEDFKRLAAFIDATGRNGTGHVVAVYLGIKCGVRLGEALGLQWRDVHLENEGAYIYIRQQYNKSHEVADTKTEKSKRSIALDPATIEYLKAWKEEQAEAMKACLKRVKQPNGKYTITHVSKRQTANTHVCTNDEGNPIDQNNFSRF